MPKPLDLTALKTVIERLEQALVRHLFSPLDLQLQDGLMLRLTRMLPQNMHCALFQNF
jgi:hypothetical protein